jgi:putative transposase
MSVVTASMLSGHPRSSHYYKPNPREKSITENSSKIRNEAVLIEAIEEEALFHPSYGVRRITAMLRRSGITVSRKRVYRIMKLTNLVKRRSVRKHLVKRRELVVPKGPNELWEEDITYIWCGSDGWCYLFNILDCYTREWVGYVFSKFCGTEESVRCLDRAIIERFPDGTLPTNMTVRNDGGPQYTSARFLEALQAYKTINHEVTGKNRPDEDAYVEAFHRSIKEDYIWQHEFESFLEADELMASFFHDYNWNRPHSSLNYLTPKEFASSWALRGVNE